MLFVAVIVVGVVVFPGTLTSKWTRSTELPPPSVTFNAWLMATPPFDVRLPVPACVKNRWSTVCAVVAAIRFCLSRISSTATLAKSRVSSVTLNVGVGDGDGDTGTEGTRGPCVDVVVGGVEVVVGGTEVAGGIVGIVAGAVELELIVVGVGIIGIVAHMVELEAWIVVTRNGPERVVNPPTMSPEGPITAPVSIKLKVIVVACPGRSVMIWIGMLSALTPTLATTSCELVVPWRVERPSKVTSEFCAMQERLSVLNFARMSVPSKVTVKLV